MNKKLIFVTKSQKGFTSTSIISLFQRVFTNVCKKSSQVFHTPRISQSFSVKQKIPQYDWCRGFTLIELLIVIAVIAILAAVLIPNLLSARNKGVDAAIKASLSGIRSEDALYYETNNASYANICTSTGTGIYDQVLSAAQKLSSSNTVATNTTFTYNASGGVGSAVCHDSATGWAAIVSLKNPSTASSGWCVDSIGNSKQTTTLVTAAVSC